jgi:hypothetical protein
VFVDQGLAVTMRGLAVVAWLLFSAPAQGRQVEAVFDTGLVGGLVVGNVSDGTMWTLSTLKLRADWSAFIEEDRTKRWRIGIEVPLHERVALALRPGIEFPLELLERSISIGLGLRSYIVPYTLHGAEAQVTGRIMLFGDLQVLAGVSLTAFFFGNDLPPSGALVEFQGFAGLRLDL